MKTPRTAYVLELESYKKIDSADLYFSICPTADDCLVEAVYHDSGNGFGVFSLSFGALFGCTRNCIKNHVFSFFLLDLEPFRLIWCQSSGKPLSMDTRLEVEHINTTTCRAD